MWSLETVAYGKIVGHACQHVSSRVSGVLLGHAGSVVDALPLTHLHAQASMQAEAALMMADVYARGKGLEVVGYYVANENGEDMSLDDIARKTAAKIGQSFKNPAVLVVNSKKLSPASLSKELAVELNVPGSVADGWKKCLPDDVYLVAAQKSTGLAAVSEFVASGAYKHLRDFDQHLDNVADDFLNQGLAFAADKLAWK